MEPAAEAAAIPVIPPEAEVEAERHARAVPERIVVVRRIEVRIAAVQVDTRRVSVSVSVVAVVAAIAVAALAAGGGLVEDRLDDGARDAGVVQGDHVVRAHVHAADVVDDVRGAARREQRHGRETEEKGEEEMAFHMQKISANARTKMSTLAW